MLRGGAGNDLPDPTHIASITIPTLILSWQDDTIHPVSTGERLAHLITGAEFHVADSVNELRTWGQRAAQFLTPR